MRAGFQRRRLVILRNLVPIAARCSKPWKPEHRLKWALDFDCEMAELQRPLIRETGYETAVYA